MLIFSLPFVCHRLRKSVPFWVLIFLLFCQVAAAEGITPKVGLYKTYRGAVKIKLPEPKYKGLAVEEAIKKRRSIRRYSRKPMTINELSELLFAANGITGRLGGYALRSAPSAGALYPIEVYAVVNNVAGLEKGIYHYSVRDHSLELLKRGDFSRRVRRAALGQAPAGEAGVNFILTSIFSRVTRKYGERGYRYAYMEVGYISENIYLEATSLGLGSVCIGAFSERSINKLLDIDGRTETAVLIHAVGKR